MQGFDDGVVETGDVDGLVVFVVGRRKGMGEWDVYREATGGMVGGLRGGGGEGVGFGT